MSDYSPQSSVSPYRDIQSLSAEQGPKKNPLKRKRNVSSGSLNQQAQPSRSEVEPGEETSKDEIILDLQEQVRFLRYLKQ